MILLTGASGFLGTAVRTQLTAAGLPFHALQGRLWSDLRNPETLPHLFATCDADHLTVIHLAYPGTAGIGTMLDTPADLVTAMLEIDLHVIQACAQARVARLVCVGSVCAYPESVTYPTDESQLWNGYPETVNAPYGIGKRMQIELLKVAARQYSLPSTHLILGNLYGPTDRSGHAIPATIRKIQHAQQAGESEIVVWGDGTVSREFLYVEDAARAVVMAATHPTALPDPINICSGEEITIRAMVEQVGEALDWHGTLRWDPTKPNGQPRRWFSHARATAALGWTPTVPFAEGIRQTVRGWTA